MAAIARTVEDAAPVRFVHVGGASGEESIDLPGAALRSSSIQLMGSGIKSVPMQKLLDSINHVFAAASAAHLQIATRSMPLAAIEEAWTSPTKPRIVITLGHHQRNPRALRMWKLILKSRPGTTFIRRKRVWLNERCHARFSGVIAKLWRQPQRMNALETASNEQGATHTRVALWSLAQRIRMVCNPELCVCFAARLGMFGSNRKSLTLSDSGFQTS